MHIRVAGHGLGGAPQMPDGIIHFSLFFEHAAQVVTGDAIQRIELHSGEKCGLGIIDAAQLVQRNSSIDMSVDPIGSKFEDALVLVDGLCQGLGRAIEAIGGLKELLGRRARHGTKLQRSGALGFVEVKSPLAADRVKRARRARRDYQYVPALLQELNFLQGQGTTAHLFFEQTHDVSHTMGWNLILREALETAESYQIAETVETFTPAGLRPDQLQPFPIAKAAHIQSQDAPYLSPRIPLRQSLLIPQIRALANDYAPIVDLCSRLFG